MSQWKKALFFRRFGSGSRDVPDEEGTERCCLLAVENHFQRSRDVPDEEGTERLYQIGTSCMKFGSRDVPDEEGTERIDISTRRRGDAEKQKCSR